jgi:hypothetical protein
MLDMSTIPSYLQGVGPGTFPGPGFVSRKESDMNENVFGNDRVYVCPHCGSTSVSAEFSFYLDYNKPYEAPNLANAIQQDSDWCYECDRQIIVIEKKGN